MTKQKQKKSEVRREQLLIAALALSNQGHYKTVSRDAIARCCGMSGTIVQHYFGTMAELRATIVKEAVERWQVRVLAQAIIEKDPNVANLTENQRRLVLEDYV